MPTLDEKLALLDALASATDTQADNTADGVHADRKLAQQLAALAKEQKAAAARARAGKAVIDHALGGFSDAHDASDEHLDDLKAALAGPLKGSALTALADAAFAALGVDDGDKAAVRDSWDDAMTDHVTALVDATTAADDAAEERSIARAALRTANEAFAAATSLIQSTVLRKTRGMDAITELIDIAGDEGHPPAKRLDAAFRAEAARAELAKNIENGGFTANKTPANRKADYLAVLTAAATAYETALIEVAAKEHAYFEAEKARLEAARHAAVAEAGGRARTAEAIAAAAP